MSVTIFDPWATTAFGLACFSAGGLVIAIAEELGRRVPAKPRPQHGLDPLLDQQLAARAARWANARGTPGLTPWAHRRLRRAIEVTRGKPPQRPLGRRGR
jgi:hypothetical protein